MSCFVAVVRCSNGAPDFDAEGQLQFPLHGRLANLPAQQVEVAIEDDQIVISGVVKEVRFHFAKLQTSHANHHAV